MGVVNENNQKLTVAITHTKDYYYGWSVCNINLIAFLSFLYSMQHQVVDLTHSCASISWVMQQSPNTLLKDNFKTLRIVIGSPSHSVLSLSQGWSMMSQDCCKVNRALATRFADMLCDYLITFTIVLCPALPAHLLGVAIVLYQNYAMRARKSIY